MNYHIKIGDNLGRTCKDQRASVIEFLQILGQDTETCEILGKFEEKNVGLLDPLNPYLGIYVEYGGGEICSNIDDFEGFNQPRKTRFKIYCSNKDDDNFILDLPEGKQGTTKCDMEFKIYSSAGCPIISSLKIKSSKILVLTLISFGFYFLFGFFINKYKYKLEGKSAIPNYIFWRQFPFLVLEGIYFIKDYINKFLNNKSKNK